MNLSKKKEAQISKIEMNEETLQLTSHFKKELQRLL